MALQNFNSWFTDILDDLCDRGQARNDKFSLVQQHFRCDIDRQGLPLLHLKPTPWRLAIKEMQWFISGSTDYADLHNSGVTWWCPWVQNLTHQDLTAKTLRTLPVTEVQIPYLKHAAAFVRISDELRSGNFDSTRLYCSLWPEESVLDQAVLPPCALAYQVTISSGRLNLSVTQRSADLLCGVPSNVIQYAWLLCKYADIAGLEPGTLDFSFGDLHVYKSHMTQSEWLRLFDRSRRYDALVYSATTSHFANIHADVSDLELTMGYSHCGKLNFPVAEVHTPQYNQMLSH